MAAQSIASRSRRPPPNEPDDAVLARALAFSEWARRNVRLIVIAGAAAVVLFAGLFWYRTDQTRRLESAAIDFMQLEQTVAAGDPSIAIRDLQQYIQSHDGTPYAEEARVMLGTVYLESEQAESAIQTLAPVAERVGRSPVGSQAALLLAVAQEEAGQRELAAQTYLRVADGGETVFRRQEGLMGAALLREEAGDWAGAAELYRRLVATTEPNTQDRNLFEMRLAEAESRALSP